MLAACEATIGRTLTDLRKSLLHQKDSEASIWELIVLYAACRRFGNKSDHEPEDAHPDVVIRGRLNRLRFSLEAKVVGRSDRDFRQQERELLGFIYRQIQKRDPHFEGANYSIDRINSDNQAVLPKENEFRSLRKDPAFREFMNALESSGSALLMLPNNNIQISYQKSSGKYVSGRLLPIEHPKTPEEHPLYRTIKQKGEQIRKWNARILSKPIVLVLCAPDGESTFGGAFKDAFNGPEQAIYNALLDPTQLAPLDVLNVLKRGIKPVDGQWQTDERPLKVSGAKHISAVLLVRLEHPVNSPLERKITKAAKAELFINYQADVPLNQSLIEEIASLPICDIEYGPGWESWQGMERAALSERTKRQGGSFTYHGRENGGFAVELPTSLVLRILAGSDNAEDLLGNSYGEPNPVSMFKAALENNQPLLDCIVSNDDSVDRSVSTIRFEFGPPQEPVVARTKKK